MDLLCIPEDPSFAVERTPYVCIDRWDGGVFMTYPLRIGKIATIPETLRQKYDELKSVEPCTELVYPTPKLEKEKFYQTWFFFGLLAEFLGLNEQQDGTRLIDRERAEAELMSLYDKCTFEKDHQQFLTGSPILAAKSSILERVRISGAGIEARVAYLHKCLQLTSTVIGVRIGETIDEPINYSIAALGELLSTEMHFALSLKKLHVEMASPFSFPWNRGYFREQSSLDHKMLESGWCRSDIVRIQHLYQGLNTAHYLSHLKRDFPRRNHRHCSRQRCIAGQMNSTTYRPAHAVENCSCASVSIDNNAVNKILCESQSYPVLYVEADDREGIRVSIENYSPDVPYIAVSHVWADGLGNQLQNALPRCQLAKLSSLVSDLKRTHSSAEMHYRLWIDTMCCPIDNPGKSFALQRITDVYQNATHVLVLDASLSYYSVGSIGVAEAAMRVVSASLWMRRLWTLQEGVLARSLYFQFADCAITAFDLMYALFNIGTQDIRFLRLWSDVNSEFRELRSFFPANRNEYDGHGTTYPATLFELQRVLHFRSVSVPSDEPLCIATLLSLNIKYVADATGADERMIRVWELFAEKFGGIPAGVIFFQDNTLETPGWRWAPRSLLASSVDSVESLRRKCMRFRNFQNIYHHGLGISTPFGLRVQFPGYLLHPEPQAIGVPLHLLHGLSPPSKADLIVRNRKTDKFYRIGIYRGINALSWTNAELDKYGARDGTPLHALIDRGGCALIKGPSHGFGTLPEHLLVEVSQDCQREQLDSYPIALQVRTVKPVLVSELSSTEAFLTPRLQKLSHDIALDDVTTSFIRLTDQNCAEYKAAQDRVVRCMKDKMQVAMESDQEFARAVLAQVYSKEDAWTLIPVKHSHDVLMVELSEDQWWIVD